MPRYTIQIVQETIVEVSAENKDAAIAEARRTYPDHKVTAVEAQVLHVED